MTVLFSSSGNGKDKGKITLKTGDKPVLGKEAQAIGARAQAIFDRASQGIPTIEKDKAILADMQKIDKEFYHSAKAVEGRTKETGNKDSHIESPSNPKKPK